MNALHLLRTFVLALAVLPAAALAEPAIRPLALQAAEDYLQRARYPQWSAALEAGAIDPLVESRTPTRQSRPGPNGAEPRLTVWASTVAARAGETVTLFASLSAPAGTTLLEAAPRKGAATITGVLEGQALGALGSVAYRDDGVAPDVLAGDGVHTASVTLPATPAPALGQADSVMVTTTAMLPDGDVRRAAGGFQFSNPAARLTGRYLDRVRDGHLVVAAEVEALAPGRVQIAGTLADAADQRFATAQAAQVLQPGTHWLELTFHGLAFHDRGVTGAVRLASVALMSTNGMPNALGPLVTNAFVTRPYTLAHFTSKPYADAALLEQARRLQRDALAAPAVR